MADEFLFDSRSGSAGPSCLRPASVPPPSRLRPASVPPPPCLRPASSRDRAQQEPTEDEFAGYEQAHQPREAQGSFVYAQYGTRLVYGTSPGEEGSVVCDPEFPFKSERRTAGLLTFSAANSPRFPLFRSGLGL